MSGMEIKIHRTPNRVLNSVGVQLSYREADDGCRGQR